MDFGPKLNILLNWTPYPPGHQLDFLGRVWGYWRPIFGFLARRWSLILPIKWGWEGGGFVILLARINRGHGVNDNEFLFCFILWFIEIKVHANISP